MQVNSPSAKVERAMPKAAPAPAQAMKAGADSFRDLLKDAQNAGVTPPRDTGATLAPTSKA